LLLISSIDDIIDSKQPSFYRSQLYELRTSEKVIENDENYFIA